MARQPTDLNFAGKDGNELHNLLLDKADFVVPKFDFDSITIPDLSGLTDIQKPVTIGDLTTRQFGGTGAFDACMESVFNHIQKEFEAGRITADEYTKQYVACIDVCLTNAVQFVLNKDASYWQGVTAQIQAIQAGIQLRITVEQAKATLAGFQADALVKSAQYTNTKMNTLTMESNYQNSEFTLDHLLPANEGLIKEQTEVQRAQTAEERIDGKKVAGSVGKNKELTDAQILAFERDAQYKVGKLHSDTWIAMRSTDEDLIPPSTFTNDAIASVVNALKLGVDIK